ncbi:MAG: hypothetical protein AB3N09_12120, partial [Tateyamaria sp.]
PASYSQPGSAPPARVYQAQGLIDGIIDDAVRVIDDAGRLFQPTPPPIPAQQLPRPTVPNLHPTVLPQPICEIATTSVDIGARLAAPINAGLERAFAVPRAQITKINASFTNASAQMAAVVAQVQEFPLVPTDIQAHSTAFKQAGSAFFLELAHLLQIALWVCVGVLIWAAVSLAGWVWARLFLGWHLMRNGTYP